MKEDGALVEKFCFMGTGGEIDCQVGGATLTFVIDSGCRSNIIDKKGWQMLKAKGTKINNTEERVERVFKAFGSPTPLRFLVHSRPSWLSRRR